MSRCWRFPERAFLTALVAVALTACITQSGTVVLLPERDGRDSALVVKQGDDTLVLDKPFAGANMTSWGPRAHASSAGDVERQFGVALAAQPSRATVFTLFFVHGTDDLTPDSQALVDSVFTELKRYPVPDVVVVGHTDAVGTEAVNDALSRKRAELVRALLIARGLAPESVVAIGRGKRDLAIPTADGVAEPRNRRAEILVR